jgi:hypothetical protein
MFEVENRRDMESVKGGEEKGTLSIIAEIR